jgi:hypothetical protein
MKTAAENIRNIATQYKTAADTFKTAFDSAIANWTGESKDAMVKFIGTTDNEDTVAGYMGKTVPQLLNGLASLLEANIQQFGETDKGIAENIPTSISSSSSGGEG